MTGKTRLSRWKKKSFFPVLLEDSKTKDYTIFNNDPDQDSHISNFDLTSLAREFIFDFKKNQPMFYVICPVFDTRKKKLKYEHAFDLNISGTTDEIEKEIINTLGIAVALDIPVYPNKTSVEKKLAYYYQKLIKNGFTAPDKDGKDIRVKPANSKIDEDYKIENITKIDLTRYWSPSDLFLIKEVVKSELSKLDNAQRTLNNLEMAINELKIELSKPTRNENKIQTCLTINPILLGLDYLNVLPKYQLGSEYQVDYALEKYSGLIDLMEIESSNLPLFTQNGNPSSHLVHAEQQIIDWIDWIEKNNSYARAKLKGLLTPKGFIIIGRESSLNEKTKGSLLRRNKAFNGLITILTYDDLLNKAECILKILKKDLK